MAILHSNVHSSAVALATLCGTTAASSLLIHASLSTKRYGEDISYSPSAAILLSEILRLCIYLAIGFNEISTRSRSGSIRYRASLLLERLFDSDFLHTMLPALFFAAQTFLQYTALDALDACTFLGTLQFRMLIAAVVGTTISQTPVNMQRVGLMILMTIGIVFMVASQFPEAGSSTEDTPVTVGMRFPGAGSVAKINGGKAVGGKQDHHKRAVEDEPTIKSNLADFAVDKVVLGMLVSLATGMFSGIGGAMLENIHDAHSPTLQGFVAGKTKSGAWVYNIRCSLLTIVGACAALGTVSKDVVSKHGLLYGFNNATWAAIIVQTVGGTVAASLYDSVTGDVPSKSALGTILLAFVGAVVMGDLELSFPYILGVILVSAALWSLSRQPVQSNTGSSSRPFGLPS